jgi:hypothetical protein
MAAISGWTFRGTSLNSGNIKITDVSGLFGLPPLRGDNWLTYGHTGQLFVPKVHDQRHIMLKIEVLDQPLNSAQALFASLSTLFANRAQGALVYTDYAAATYTAQAECYAWTPAIQTKPALVWEGIADFLLADPWLYGVTVSGSVTPTSTATFGTVVSNNLSTTPRTTVPLVVTGVISGTPLLVGFIGQEAAAGITSIADSFGGHYTFTKVESNYDATSQYDLELWIATGGTGTSGTVTITCSSSWSGGWVVPLFGASASAGLLAVDVHGQTGGGAGAGYTTVTQSLTPTAAGELAVYAMCVTVGTVISGPAAPWVPKPLSGWGVPTMYAGILDMYASPASGVALAATWSQSVAGNPPLAMGAIVKTAGGAPSGLAVTNSGTALNEKATLDILGPIYNPTVVNSTTGTSVTFTGTVASTKHLILDAGAYTAVNDGANVIGAITHSGAAPFITLAPGVNNLLVYGSGCTGATLLTVAFAPPYE